MIADYDDEYSCEDHYKIKIHFVKNGNVRPFYCDKPEEALEEIAVSLFNDWRINFIAYPAIKCFDIEKGEIY